MKQISLIKIIENLASTASTLEKQEILTKHKDNEDLKKIFLWTYNPFVNYYIKKIPVPKTYGKRRIDDAVTELGSLLQDLNARTVTGHDASNEVLEFLQTFDKESAEFITKVISRDLRCNVTDTTANKIWKNLIPTFEVQLANTFDPEKPTAKEYYVSPKMDGLRGMYISGQGLFTRQGKRIVGFSNLEAELEKVCYAHEIGAVDGELYSTEIDFEHIQGAVMRNKNIREEDKEKIKFYVFALLKNFKKQEVFETTKEMISEIENIFKKKRDYLVQVDQKLVKVADIEKVHDRYAALGYEGIMLRSVDVSYEFKRSKYLLKFKKFLEADFTVVGSFEGKGKYQSGLGGIQVEGEFGGVKISSEVGSGFNDEQREEFWKNSLVGKKVEVKFQGVTPDGSLRFPVFNKVKLDR